MRQDEIKQALTWHEKELELRQQTLSDDMDVSIAPTLQALGEVLIRLNKSDLAMAHFKRALKIRQKAFVDGHPTVAATLLSIGRVHHDAKREAEALVAYNKALEYREAKHGPLHPGVASVFSAIGELYLQQNKLNEALAFHQKAMKIRTVKLAHDHPDIAHTHHYLGETYTKMGRHEVRALVLSYCHTVTLLHRRPRHCEQHPAMHPALTPFLLTQSPLAMAPLPAIFYPLGGCPAPHKEPQDQKWKVRS